MTGATGFIGSHLAKSLLAAGHPLRLLVRQPSRLQPDLIKGCDVVVGDLTDSQCLTRAARGVGSVFHCAANVRSWDTPARYLADNVDGLRNLMVALAQENQGPVRFVHLSTVDVYGFPATPCSEEGPTQNSGFGYGDSKLLGESIIRELGAAYGISYTILRPTNVIGPGSPFITRIGDQLHSGVMLTVDGGQANAGLLWVDHLVAYMRWAAESDLAVGQTYNVRDAEDMSWATFIRLFRLGIDGRGLVIDLPFALADALAGGLEFIQRGLFPAREPLLHRLIVRIFGRTCGHDATKIRVDSGLVFRETLEQGLERSFRWFLDRHRATSRCGS